MKRLILLACAMAMALAGCVDTDQVRRTRQFDEAAFARVRPGQSADQVLERLGTPTRVATEGRVVWYYGTGFPARSPVLQDEAAPGRRLGAVAFTRTLRVDKVALYGLNGGVVIDRADGRRADDGTVAMWRLLFDEP